MTETAWVQLRQVRVELNTALSWAKLDALTGRLLAEREAGASPIETTDGGSSP